MIDKEQLNNHFDNDKELIMELVEVFEQTYTETFAELESAVGSKDFANIELHAHTLKGMIANFFALELKETAYIMEQVGRDSSDQDLTEHLEKLRVGIPQMLNELKSM